MYNDQTLALMQRYALEGKSFETFIADYQALAASGKTALGLNQWIKSDKPTMADFNEDNRIIDEKLRELAAGKVVTDEKLQQLSEKKANIGTPTRTILPVSSGYNANYAQYSKDSFNRCLIEGTIVKTSGTIAANEVVATLPAGYRPQFVRQMHVDLFHANLHLRPWRIQIEYEKYFHTSTWSGGVAKIETNGQITVSPYNASFTPQYVYFDLIFTAVQ